MSNNVFYIRRNSRELIDELKKANIPMSFRHLQRGYIICINNKYRQQTEKVIKENEAVQDEKREDTG